MEQLQFCAHLTSTIPVLSFSKAHLHPSHFPLRRPHAVRASATSVKDHINVASVSESQELAKRGAQTGVAGESGEAAQHSERASTHASASSSGRRAEWLASAALEAIVQEDSEWYPWRYGSRIHYRHAATHISHDVGIYACGASRHDGLCMRQAARHARASSAACAWVWRRRIPVVSAHGATGRRAPGVGAGLAGAGPLLAIGAGACG